MSFIFKIEELPNQCCRFTQMGGGILGGSVPLFITNFFVQSNLTLPTRTQIYFQKLRPLSQLTVKDGEALGELLMIKLKGEKESGKEKGLSGR